MLRYWTTRYVITLCIGLLVIGIISGLWIQYNEAEKRLNMMSLMAEEIAERIVDTNGELSIGPFLGGFFNRRLPFLHLEDKPLFFIIDQQKQVIFADPPQGKMGDGPLMDIKMILDDQTNIGKTENKHGGNMFFVKREVETDGHTIGWVVLLSPEKEITQSKSEMQLLITLLGSLALLGWIVIYLFVKKLATPIKDVADAAKQIVKGNYRVNLQREVKEQELAELLESFRNMADRLAQLESMRTELLAGVTHELKTPVTSISGLVQAVKDDIVTGEEAKEFLEICTKETGKLQKMVEDLLEFNSFTVGNVRIRKEHLDLPQLIQEIAHQWEIVQDENTVVVHLDMPDKTLMLHTDPLRVQQILYNLLNNAKQASKGIAEINIRLYETGQGIAIEVRDCGSGIPREEQSLIFEKFFRGEAKKHKVRGLGLGLPFSRLLAQALGGDLQLTESSEKGTTFTLSIPAL
nr:HAMP domain-containing sensor histidine kinase [Brevibacillus fulvus]